MVDLYFFRAMPGYDVEEFVSFSLGIWTAKVRADIVFKLLPLPVTNSLGKAIFIVIFSSPYVLLHEDNLDYIEHFK